VNVPSVDGVAVTVAVEPAQVKGLFTLTIGSGFTVIVPNANKLIQLVVVSLILTPYIPETPDVILVAFPGLITPVGTVQV
jgi:hypothetical protein